MSLRDPADRREHPNIGSGVKLGGLEQANIVEKSARATSQDASKLCLRGQLWGNSAEAPSEGPQSSCTPRTNRRLPDFWTTPG